MGTPKTSPSYLSKTYRKIDICQKMKLVHYTADADLQIEYKPQTEDGTPFKPRGLWVSDEDSDWTWPMWCRQEEWALESFVWAYEIHLVEYHHLHVLSTPEEVREFTHQFDGGNDSFCTWDINWDEVRVRWNGIVITPYQSECRIDPKTIWYCGWDCASGCIWNMDVISSITKTYVKDDFSDRSQHG